VKWESVPQPWLHKVSTFNAFTKGEDYPPSRPLSRWKALYHLITSATIIYWGLTVQINRATSDSQVILQVGDQIAVDVISLPMSPLMKASDQEKVVFALQGALA